MSSLVVNDLRFEVRRSSERRSLEITVDRTGPMDQHRLVRVSVAI